MPERFSNVNLVSTTLEAPEIPRDDEFVSSSNAERRRVMAEMGSVGGKIGGKRRAEKMSPGARKASASAAARARWSKGTQPTAEEKRQKAAEKIAAILEQAMNDLGLTEDQKDAKTAEMAQIAMAAIKARS